MRLLSPRVNPCPKIVELTTFLSRHRYYCLSILDKHHHPDINLEQGLKLLNLCTDELKRRLPIDFKGVCASSHNWYRNFNTNPLAGFGQDRHKRWY